MTQNKCARCGANVPHGSNVCPQCGQIQSPTVPIAPTSGSHTQPLPSSPKPKGKVSIALVAGLCIAAALIGGAAAFFISSKANEPETPAEQTTETEASVGGRTSEVHEEGGVTPYATAPRKLRTIPLEMGNNVAPQAGNTYVTANLLDGDPATCWAISADDEDNMDMSGITGPRFRFARPVKLSHIVLQNGYAKSVKRFKENSRAASFHIFNADYTHPSDFEMATEFLFDGPVVDTPEPQTLHIDPKLESNNKIKSIIMAFWPDDIIEGTRWNDLSISEIEFYGWEQ